MAKRQVYSFVERKFSANGIAGAVCSILAFIMLLILLGVAFILKGTASSWIGAVGITGIVLAFLGIHYGLAGFRDECKSYICSKIGTIMGTVVIAAWFFLICIGIAGG